VGITVNVPVNLPHFEGWHLIGAFPDNEPGDVGSWLLVHNGEALLLEVPEGLAVQDVTDALGRLRVMLRYVTASHDHYDHLDPEVWDALAAAFPDARFLHPSGVRGDRLLHVGDEPVWLVKAPKHSLADVVAVFRGVAMTGDIELGMLESVNDEVPSATRRRSMRRLREFQDRTGYHVHSVVSAHLNDVRLSVRWPDLFEF
jgi:glyoxylase-like metal-dependent hydrolase (beta-lactamase superfamily II)